MSPKYVQRAQQGFTLIELIITIVIIGVLAAVAIPKFQSLSSDAEKSVAEGVGAALSSASSVNYAKGKSTTAVQCTAVNTPVGCTYYPIVSCADLATYAQAIADVPTTYVIAGNSLGVTGNSGTCTLTKGTTVVTFSAYGAA